MDISCTFSLKKTTTINTAKCATTSLTVHLHRHDVSTVILDHPITSMTCTLSCWCLDRADDNQSRSRILLWFWLEWRLCEDSDQNSPLRAPEYKPKYVWWSNLLFGGWGNGTDKNCVTLIGKTLGGDGIKIKCLEMRSVYPLPDTNLSCANYYQPLFLVFRKWLARRS